jgi:hypothetical protein
MVLLEDHLRQVLWVFCSNVFTPKQPCDFQQVVRHGTHKVMKHMTSSLLEKSSQFYFGFMGYQNTNVAWN